MSKRELITAELERVGMRRGMYCRSAQIAKREAPAPEGGKPPIIPWILATEQPVMMFCWQRYEFWPEVLVAAGMTAPSQVPLIDTHMRYSIDYMLGSVADFSLDKTGEYAANAGNVRLSATAEKATTLINEGHLIDGSVGYVEDEAWYVTDDMTTVINGIAYVGPVKVVTKWRLQEFSLTPIGADALAKIKRMITEDKTNV
jgi:hypothetical protein